MFAFLTSIVLLLLGCVLNEIQNKYQGEMLYLCRNERLITPNKIGNQDIQILYKKQPIESLSVAKLLIVNNTKQALKNTDLSKEGFVIKTQGDGKILRIDLQNSTDTSNVYELPIEANKKTVSVKFHHLNPGDSWLFQVFHTGKSSDDLLCSCSAAGIIKTKRISIIGHSFSDLIITTIFHFILYMVLIAISISLIEKGKIIAWSSIIPIGFLILLIKIMVSSWELDYRFNGWYKMAQKNGF